MSKDDTPMGEELLNALHSLNRGRIFELSKVKPPRILLNKTGINIEMDLLSALIILDDVKIANVILPLFTFFHDKNTLAETLVSRVYKTKMSKKYNVVKSYFPMILGRLGAFRSLETFQNLLLSMIKYAPESDVIALLQEFKPQPNNRDDFGYFKYTIVPSSCLQLYWLGQRNFHKIMTSTKLMKLLLFCSVEELLPKMIDSLTLDSNLWKFFYDEMSLKWSVYNLCAYFGARLVGDFKTMNTNSGELPSICLRMDTIVKLFEKNSIEMIHFLIGRNLKQNDYEEYFLYALSWNILPSVKFMLLLFKKQGIVCSEYFKKAVTQKRISRQTLVYESLEVGHYESWFFSKFNPHDALIFQSAKKKQLKCLAGLLLQHLDEKYLVVLISNYIGLSKYL